MQFHAEKLVLEDIEGDYQLTADNQLIAYGHTLKRDHYILLGGVAIGNLTQWAVRPSDGWEGVKQDYIRTFSESNDLIQFTGADMVRFSRAVGQVIRRGQEIVKE